MAKTKEKKKNRKGKSKDGKIAVKIRKEKKKGKGIVAKDKTKDTSGYKHSEVVVDLPKHDTDVTLRLPNGQLMEVQFRVEQPSVDFVLPEDCAVTNWQGDDMEPAKALRGKPGQGSMAHVRLAKQLAIPLDPAVID